MTHSFKKHFGQNFLRSLDSITKVCSYLDSDIKNVIEIGPGDGGFTQKLLDLGYNVTCIEIDEDLIPVLNSKFAQYKNFNIVHGDVLQIDVESIFPNEEYQVFGALPYNISKRIVNLFLDLKNHPKSFVYIMQKEVAEDYAAKPPKATFLSTLVSLYGVCDYKMTIANTLFYPVPKVDGGVIRFSFRDNNVDQRLIKFVKNAFISPRKTLSNNLKSVFHFSSEEMQSALSELSVLPTARAAELSVEQYKKLFEIVFKNK